MVTDEKANSGDNASRFLALIEVTAISIADAKSMVEALYTRRAKRYPSEGREAAVSYVADQIVNRYAKMAAMSGAVTALPGAVPGIGTVGAIAGGGVDLTVSMKLQVDMCRCLAVAFDYDLTNEEAKTLTMIVAFSGALENLAGPQITKIGTEAGVKMLKQYLKGAVLKTLKELLKKIGVTFTRKALEKAIPFGVGIVVSSSLNYALTRYVGREAKKVFAIDVESRSSAAGLATSST